MTQLTENHLNYQLRLQEGILVTKASGDIYTGDEVDIKLADKTWARHDVLTEMATLSLRQRVEDVQSKIVVGLISQAKKVFFTALLLVPD